MRRGCGARTVVAHLAQTDDLTMPLPEIQIIGGGAHAQGRIDLQDIMALPVGAPDWRTALDWCARTYHAMGAILADAGQLRGVADEGGFWPDISGNEEALALMVQAIERAGLVPLDDVAISLDIAANQFYRGERYWLRADAAAISRRTSGSNGWRRGARDIRSCSSRIRAPRTIDAITVRSGRLSRRAV